MAKKSRHTMPRTKKRRKMMQPRTFELEIQWDENGRMKIGDGIRGLLDFARECEQKDNGGK